MSNGQRYTPEEIDQILDSQADKLGNYTLATKYLEGLGLLASQEFNQEDPWQQNWLPSTPSELHAAKSNNDTKKAFANRAISAKAKRARFEKLKELRAAALKDRLALHDAETIDEFCESDALDAIERHIVGEELVRTLRENPKHRFTHEDITVFTQKARSLLGSCQDNDEFLVYAHDAQVSHEARFTYWLSLIKELEDQHPFLKQIQ